MPQIRISNEARQDLGHFSDILIKNGANDKAKSVIEMILQSLGLLKNLPMAGSTYPIEGKKFREVLIEYEASGYACLYSFDKDENLIIIHSIQQRERNYI